MAASAGSQRQREENSIWHQRRKLKSGERHGGKRRGEAMHNSSASRLYSSVVKDGGEQNGKRKAKSIEAAKIEMKRRSEKKMASGES